MDPSEASRDANPRRQLGAGLDSAFGRRLSDKLLLAFHQACEQQDVEVAQRLLDVLGFMWLRDADAPWGRRSNVNYLVPAREKFLHLQYLAQSQAPGPDARPDRCGMAAPAAAERALVGEAGHRDGARWNISEPGPSPRNPHDNR